MVTSDNPNGHRIHHRWTQNRSSHIPLISPMLGGYHCRDVPTSSRSEQIEMRSVRISSPTSVDIEMTPDLLYYDEFSKMLGKFGAPKCRCTSSLVSLIAMCVGLVLFTTGLCFVTFFPQEALFLPPGITFFIIGILLLLIGCALWTSEFMCNDCLATVAIKMEEAPIKNAIKRREERLRSGASTRNGSRLSLNSRTSLCSAPRVSSQPRY